ncbi:MAG: metallophosphoesterase [Patescibacteria group bacterium]|nr:metallophosphoesterase [Patescibacteria group bacterium]
MLSIPIILIGICLWAGVVEPNLILEENIEVGLEGLNQEMKELKFVHISDLHFFNFGFKEKSLIEKLNRIKPDYIFITGDLVDWSTQELEQAEEFFKKIADIAPDKTFGVYGNHEHRHIKFFEVRKRMKQAGIRILNNESVLLEQGIYLVGVDDPHSEMSDLPAAFNGIDMEKPKILLAHSPEIFREIECNNILVLAGHTHGGQINIPILVNYFLPMKYDTKYKSGLFNKSSQWLYVNRGIGTTFLPIRLNAFPELTIIKLK